MHIKNIFSSLSIFPKIKQPYLSEEVKQRNTIRKCMEEQASRLNLINPLKPQTEDTFELSNNNISTEDALNILWPDI